MIDFPRIAQAALDRAETLVTRWLPAGRRNGQEWLVGDLCGNPGESTSINLRTGVWADFAGDAKGGDLISLYAAIHQCDQAKAAREIGQELGIEVEPPAEKPKRKGQQWTQVVPAPDHVPPPTLRHFHYGPPEARWCYRDADGRVVGWIARFRKSEGGKEVMPCTWARELISGEEAWKWLSFPKPRPLYGLPELAAAKPDARVAIVEGEKCADALRSLGALTVTWPGGGKAVGHADWTPLAGRKVTIWPDRDRKTWDAKETKIAELVGVEKAWEKQPGYKAMMDIAEILHELGCEVRLITPPEGKPDGWDCADAIEEGWGKAEVAELFKSAVVYQPELPPLPEPPPPPRDLSDAAEDDDHPYEFLGHDQGLFYYLSHGSRQIVSLNARQHAKNDLLQLAPLDYWMRNYPGKDNDGQVSWLFAANSLIQRSMMRGIFDPGMVRGRGAWLDDGRVVYHAGDQLHVDGQVTRIERMQSRYIYQRGRSITLPEITPADERQASKLIALLQATNLRHPMDPLLLAGWLVCAPICGALEWRPHIWISGKAGSGKTWLIEKVIQRIIGEAAIIAQGTSTSEPGIRQTLRSDALPVVIDEAETENKADQERIQRILMLARQASRESRARIIKGSASGEAMEFTVRSMFLFSSIGVAATQRADLSRITAMELVPGRHAGNPDQWQDLQDFQALTTGDPSWCAALRARALKLAPVIAANAHTFATACTRHLGAQRDGDQIGALLAGAWSLTSSQEVTPDEAAAWCAKQDWSAFQSQETDMDEHRAFSILMTAIIGHEEAGRIHRLSIAELIKQGSSYTNHDQAAAKATLERHGIAIRRGGFIDISDNHQELRRLFADTPFAGKWADQLRRLPGAEKRANSHFNGVQSRATRLPSALFEVQGED
jgi:putative DNA primase/helicase